MQKFGKPIGCRGRCSTLEGAALEPQRRRLVAGLRLQYLNQKARFILHSFRCLSLSTSMPMPFKQKLCSLDNGTKGRMTVRHHKLTLHLSSSLWTCKTYLGRKAEEWAGPLQPGFASFGGGAGGAAVPSRQPGWALWMRLAQKPEPQPAV